MARVGLRCANPARRAGDDTTPVPSRGMRRAGHFGRIGSGETMAASDFRYIVVEGPIGVGKTTLARRLAKSLDGAALLEAPAENPFLPRFYENPQMNALPTQLFFLLQRVRQLEALRQSDLFARVRVGDFMIEKDRLFAELTLDADELALYRQVYERTAGAAVTPDLVIYLQAPVDVLLRRIAARGIPYEEYMDPRYLDRVASAYTRFFHHYEGSPLVIVNAAEIDFAHGDADYEQLFDMVRSISRGRHYLNPLPL